MMDQKQREVLTLTEYTPQFYPQETFTEEVGERLWQKYRKQVTVEFPSPKTGGQWQLTARGWIGYIPLAATVGLSLQPKVPLGNLFRMLEIAYSLESLDFPDDLFNCSSLVAFYERLAHVLAHRVLDRCRKGIYRSYVPHQEVLPYIRGRFQLQEALRTPWNTQAPCRYEEHTGDIEENQILAWTLWSIIHSGLCTERVMPNLRRAYRALQGVATARPFTAQDCINRVYNRLNSDYHPLHALCRFFLDQSGPGHAAGDHPMLPFLVDMAHLYERFIAQWLKQHQNGRYRVMAQERVDIDAGSHLHFRIDLVLYDIQSGDVRWVMDTKYKANGSPNSEDIAQVVAYASAKGCQEAILLYPTPLDQPLDRFVGPVRVRSLSFLLDGDLAQAGQAFLHQLLQG